MKTVWQTPALENQYYENTRENEGVVFGSDSLTLLHHDASISESISSWYKGQFLNWFPLDETQGPLYPYPLQISTHMKRL